VVSIGAFRSVLLAAAISVSGCGSRGVTTTPTPATSTAAATTSAESVRAQLTALLTTLQRYSINTDKIDWPGLRSEVLAAGEAGTVEAYHAAIGIALRLLNDEQSYFQPARGGLIGPSPVGGCAGGAPTPASLPVTIGYVKVGMCDCAGSGAPQFAESVQRAIREADRPDLVGWIVDLRGNVGGNMWAMIAGVGPVLGEGVIGWVQYNDREYEREYRDGAALSLDEPFVRVGSPYRLIKDHPKVAVLTDGGVSSAGEAVTVFFRGRPGTRSFGTPTCGHHHIQQTYFFSDGTLFLVTNQHADRLKRRYPGSVAPDEIVLDANETVNRAVRWLLEGR
jgi:hypothetical protein